MAVETITPPSQTVRKPAGNTKYSVRKWVAWAHLWLGLPAGLLLCLFTLSGSIIVFRAEIERAFEPQQSAGGPCQSPLDLDAALQQVTAYTKGARVGQINIPAGAGRNYQFVARNAGRVIVDSCSGTVLGATKSPVLDFLVDLHHNLLNGKTGRGLTGIIGIVLFTLALSGLIIWLLSNPNLRTAFAVKAQGPPRRFVWELHRAAGLGAMLFLTLSSLTGISLAYPETVRQAIDSVTGHHPEARPERTPRKKKDAAAADASEPQHLRPLADYAFAAEQALPGARIREIRLPETAGGPVQLRLWAPGDFRSSGNNRITLDAASLKVVSLTKFSDAAASLKVTQGATALHYAEWGGTAVQVLWFVAGLMPSVLFVSGGLIWWLRRKPKSRKDLN